MNICANCGNPISKLGTGIIHATSNHCSRCNSQIYPSSSKTSQQSSLGFQPICTTSRPSSKASDGVQETNSAQSLTEKVVGIDPEIVSVDRTESEVDMNSDTQTPQPVLSDDDPLPTAEEREEARRLSLSRQGFVIEEDAHGLRLSGVASRPGGLSSELSPYDIVRLAAELEGGVVPMEQRKRCPKCEAVVNPGDKHCQWCSEQLNT